MKKLAAISLLTLLLFNTVGYRFVFTMLDNIASATQDAKIDAGDYNEASLIEIKVPLNMPYQQRFTEFERHYGQITVDGIVYTYVKMKVDDNMLILKCLPDFNRQQIKNSENSLAKANSSQDMEHNGKKHSSAAKVFSADYDDKNHSWVLDMQQVFSKAYLSNTSTPLKNAFLSIPHQPPQC